MHDVKSDEEYEIFLRYFSQDRDRILAYIHSLLPHRADAEDVFQRCSVLLWRKFEDFDTQRDFLPWACGVAYYEVRNFLRVSARDRLQFDGELIEQLAEQRLQSLQKVDHRLNALNGCLQSLKVADRELVDAVYNEALPLSEFAESTGRALQTLYNRLSIVRRQLLNCVQRKLATEGELG